MTVPPVQAQPPEPPAPSPGAFGFAADAYLAAHEPPTYRHVDGRVFRGVLVSADEWFSMAPQLAAAVAGTALSRRAETRLLRDLTMLSFPRRWWQRFAAWPRGRESVWTLLQQLPRAAQLEAVASFINAQARAQHGEAWATARSVARSALAVTAPEPETATRGTDSPR